MTARRRFLSAKAAAIVLVGAAFLQPRPGRAQRLEDVGPGIRRMVGRPALDILLAAQRAEVFRLVDDAPPGDSNDRRLISGYQPARGPLALDKALLVAFRDELLRPATYVSFVMDEPPGRGDIAKACGGFRPGVAVRFYEGAGAHRYVDALLCFHCADIAIVAGGSRRVIAPQFIHMDPLLRLAAAAIPDDRKLAELQARRSDQQAREELFLGTFPAAAQVHLDAASNGKEGLDRAADDLRRDIPEKELFRLAAQSLGVLREDPETVGDHRALVVARAVSKLPPEIVAAGLRDIANDQVALAGVQTLLLLQALDGLSVQVRDAWLPRITEAALVQFPQTRWCVRMAALAAQPNKAVVPLLRRVARGELPVSPRRWEEEAFLRTPPARGCALMALGANDPDGARAILPTFADASTAPLHPLDLAAARAVRFRLGDQRALDQALLSVESGTVQTYVLDTIRARPTQVSLGVLIEYGLDKVRGADSVFTELTGFSLAYVPDERRATTAQEWWRANGATWRPPVR